MPFVVVGNVLAKAFDKYRPLWPRPYEAHVAANYIDKLRDFVQPEFADKLADPRHSRIVLSRPLGAIGELCIHPHRPELQHLERLPSQADALLPEDRRTFRIQPHRNRHQHHHRQRKHQPKDPETEVQRPFDRQIEPRAVKALGEYEPAWLDALKPDAARKRRNG